MKSFFDKEFFSQNRKQLRNVQKTNYPLVFSANGLMQRNDDNTYRFRQDSNFWYLTGINLADAILVMDKSEDYLILADQEDFQRIFEGAVVSDDVAKTSGINTILDEKAGWKRLLKSLKTAKQVTTCAAPEPYIDFYKFYTNPARRALLTKMQSINPSLKINDIRSSLTAMRMIKQPEELETIKLAIDITVDTLDSVRIKLSDYTHEYQIEADLTHGYRTRGAQGHSFHPIVAGGRNACILHYYANNDALDKARFILFDTGAELDNYAADIGCTYWLKERTKREADVYAAVVDVQKYAYSLLKPGMFLKDYEKLVEQFMGEKLRSLGLIKSTERADIRHYFPHATSHHVGLDAHDTADYEAALQPGMVLAVEPGIYIPEESIGIRIEHNVLITKNGIKVLSKNLLQ